MKLSDLRSAAEIHEQDMRDPAYKQEYDRLKLANDVAVQVLAYRTEHGLSQTELARRLGMKQPNIARLESGEHEPSLSTLARLSLALGLDFSIDIKAGGLRLRRASRPRKTASTGIALSKLEASAALANQTKRSGSGAWASAARGRQRAGDAEAPRKTGGSGRSLPGRRPPACPAPRGPAGKAASVNHAKRTCRTPSRGGIPGCEA